MLYSYKVKFDKQKILSVYQSFLLFAFLGSIIRSMRRLEELLRQMAQASKNMGNAELETKFSESIKLLKRDIVFATSLYL